MLSLLKVKNLAIVENAEVEFAPGLNIITGETGSGKTVIIGAISLIVGERADRSAVRNGESELSVEARFSVPSESPVNSVLADAGLPPCEYGELLIRRTVAVSGTGRCYVNDTQTTLATLRLLGQHLIDMHGPYDHQSLLSPDFQLAILDEFAHDAEPYEAYHQAYKRLVELLKERERLSMASGTEIERRIMVLRETVSEIDDAALTEDDGPDLIERHAQAAAAGEIIALGDELVNALTDGEAPLFDALISVQQRLAELARIFPQADDWREDAASAGIQIQELSRSISERMQRIDSNGELLAELEARMAIVQKLKRKYGQTVQAVLSLRDEKKTELDGLLFKTARLATLDDDIISAAKLAREAAALLTKRRKEAAETLSESIAQQLRPLGFKQAVFKVTVEPRGYEDAKSPDSGLSPSGADVVSFAFAPNPGEATLPLKTIASSGEIARVMLAVKTVLAKHDSIPILVFDEIDSNIGGEVGRQVGEKLLSLAQTHQVVSITHLPQVAAYGQTHFAVAKRIRDNRTSASIQQLDEDQRAEEIARMLGGADFTSITLCHAKEMLKRCMIPPQRVQ